MIKLRIERDDTQTGDIVVSTDAAFPLAYVGRGTYIGDMQLKTYHDISSTEKVHLIYIGRYTSIGAGISIYCDINHDYRSVYMGVIPEYANLSEDSPIRERWGQITKRMKHKGMVIIGNDVWIGDNVTIISDITIGNGAVIGAGSVVAKDIPPYTIWCGNPAVCIGSRFSPETIAGLQKIAWWDKDPNILKQMETDMKGEADDLVKKYEPLANDSRDITETFGFRDDITTMVAFVDTETAYPTYGDIIEKFIERFFDQSSELILCYYSDSESDREIAKSLSAILAPVKESVSVRLLEISHEDDESVISRADCLILGRDIKNISRISYAFKYNVKLLSGVNSPMF